MRKNVFNQLYHPLNSPKNGDFYQEKFDFTLFPTLTCFLKPTVTFKTAVCFQLLCFLQLILESQVVLESPKTTYFFFSVFVFKCLMLRALLKHYFIADILKKATLSTLVVPAISSFYSPFAVGKIIYPHFSVGVRVRSILKTVTLSFKILTISKFQ